MPRVKITDKDKQRIIAANENREKIAIVEDYREFTLQQIKAKQASNILLANKNAPLRKLDVFQINISQSFLDTQENKNYTMRFTEC